MFYCGQNSTYYFLKYINYKGILLTFLYQEKEINKISTFTKFFKIKNLLFFDQDSFFSQICKEFYRAVFFRSCLLFNRILCY